MACPAASSARILKNVFFVYGGASVEPPPMLYSSSSSDHEEIPLAFFNSTSAKKWLVSYYDTNHFSVQQLS